MGLSRRLRFEILRRDNHTCRYCGAMAPDVTLTVDHVTPVALGGSDDPTNLVAACQDCNAGKSSIRPNDSTVADVQADALRWALAIEQAAHNMLADRELIDAGIERFEAAWNEWTYSVKVAVPPDPVEPTGNVLVDNWYQILRWHARHSRPVGFENGVLRIQVERGCVTDTRRELGYADARRQIAELVGSTVEKVEVVPGWDGPLPPPPRATTREEQRPFPLPGGWQQSVERFIAAGLLEESVHQMIQVAMGRRGLLPDDRFRFFCGCCWRAITDLQEDARRIIETEDAPYAS